MATFKPYGLQSARAVDPNAIAIFLNYRLQSQGMTARVVLKQRDLKILVEASQIPPQQVSVELIRQAITSFKISVAHPVKVYGRIRGRQSPSWSQQLNCLTPAKHSFDTNLKNECDRSKGGEGGVLPSWGRSPHIPIYSPNFLNWYDNLKSKIQNPKWYGVLAIGGAALLMPLGVLWMWNGASGISVPFQATHSTQTVQTAAVVHSPPPAAPQTSRFQAAIDKAMQAATRTQSAKSREDWQQASDLWQEAIVRLEQVIPTDAHYPVAQQKITQYQRNFVYAQQRFQAIPTPSKLGVTQRTVQSLFQDEKTGFRFRNATALDGQPRLIGYSANGLAMLELVGAADLSKVTIVVGLPDDDASARALNRIYMLRVLQHLIPDWSDAADWLSQGTAQLADGYTGDLITIRHNKRIKLSAIGAAGTLVLVVEPN